MRCPDPGEEKPEVVVNLGHRSNRRAGVRPGAALLDAYRGREAFYVIDVGFFHLPQELTGVRGERFHIPALALGIDGIESQRRLARPAETRDHSELVTWYGYIYRLEIMLSRTLDHNLVLHSVLSPWFCRLLGVGTDRCPPR